MIQQGVDKEVGNAAQSKYSKKKMGHEEVEIKIYKFWCEGE